LAWPALLLEKLISKSSPANQSARTKHTRRATGDGNVLLDRSVIGGSLACPVSENVLAKQSSSDLGKWKSSQCVLVVSLRIVAEHRADQSFGARCVIVPKVASREPAIAAPAERRFLPRAQFSKPSVVIPYTGRFCSAPISGFQHNSLSSLPGHHVGTDSHSIIYMIFPRSGLGRLLPLSIIQARGTNYSSNGAGCRSWLLHAGVRRAPALRTGFRSATDVLGRVPGSPNLPFFATFIAPQ
jgi:hypothetical protein